MTDKEQMMGQERDKASRRYQTKNRICQELCLVFHLRIHGKHQRNLAQFEKHRLRWIGILASRRQWTLEAHLETPR